MVLYIILLYITNHIYIFYIYTDLKKSLPVCELKLKKVNLRWTGTSLKQQLHYGRQRLVNETTFLPLALEKKEKKPCRHKFNLPRLICGTASKEIARNEREREWITRLCRLTPRVDGRGAAISSF